MALLLCAIKINKNTFELDSGRNFDIFLRAMIIFFDVYNKLNKHIKRIKNRN
jgi:hypothetical protein